jgi:hypothetical protein
MVNMVKNTAAVLDRRPIVAADFDYETEAWLWQF